VIAPPPPKIITVLRPAAMLTLAELSSQISTPRASPNRKPPAEPRIAERGHLRLAPARRDTNISTVASAKPARPHRMVIQNTPVIDP